MSVASDEIAELTGAITDEVNQMVASCRSGERCDEYGAPMRYLTRLEASKIARNGIEDFFNSDHRRAFDYIVATPEIRDMHFGGMTLSEALVYGPTENLLYRTMLDVRHLVHDQTVDQSSDELLDDILATIEMFSPPSTGTSYARISKLVVDFRNDPDAKAFKQIGMEIGTIAMHLRHLTVVRERSGVLSGLENVSTAHRWLREAQDKINLVLELERFNAFCDTSRQASHA